MWWQVLFWLLLIPLVIAEILIFWKTKRFYWLLFALAIFVYVVAVSYTLDVFDASRNAIILTLLFSAVLMALIGKHLGKNVQKQKKVSRKAAVIVLALFGVIIILFVVSAVFGKLDETVTVVEISAQDILSPIDKDIVPRNVEGDVVLLKRTLKNNCFLPVPIQERFYTACLILDSGERVQLSHADSFRSGREEVSSHGERTLNVKFFSHRVKEETAAPTEVWIYEVEEENRWNVDCYDAETPSFVVPVQ